MLKINMGIPNLMIARYCTQVTNL